MGFSLQVRELHVCVLERFGAGLLVAAVGVVGALRSWPAGAAEPSRCGVLLCCGVLLLECGPRYKAWVLVSLQRVARRC